METFKERFDDLLDDFKGRVKNPLILSFILVWVYQHWRLLYQFWAVDNKIPFSGRIHLFNIYIDRYGFNGMVLEPLYYAFGSLIIFYLIGIIAQAIKLFVGKRLPAYLFAKLDTENYDLKINSEKYKKKYKKYKADIVSIEEDYDLLKNDYDDKYDKLQSAERQIELAEKEQEQLLTQISEFQKQKQTYEKVLNDEHNFMIRRTRKSLFQLFDYKLNYDDDTYGKKSIPVTELFFGKWAKTIFLDNLAEKSNGAIEVNFENENILDVQKNYYSKITSLHKMGNYDIYKMYTRNSLNIKSLELLIKVDANLIIGILTDEKGEGTTLVEYYKTSI